MWWASLSPLRACIEQKSRERNICFLLYSVISASGSLAFGSGLRLTSLTFPFSGLLTSTGLYYWLPWFLGLLVQAPNLMVVTYHCRPPNPWSSGRWKTVISLWITTKFSGQKKKKKKIKKGRETHLVLKMTHSKVCPSRHRSGKSCKLTCLGGAQNWRPNWKINSQGIQCKDSTVADLVLTYHKAQGGYLWLYLVKSWGPKQWQCRPHHLEPPGKLWK